MESVDNHSRKINMHTSFAQNFKAKNLVGSLQHERKKKSGHSQPPQIKLYATASSQTFDLTRPVTVVKLSTCNFIIF